MSDYQLCASCGGIYIRVGDIDCPCSQGSRDIRQDTEAMAALVTLASKGYTSDQIVAEIRNASRACYCYVRIDTCKFCSHTPCICDEYLVTRDEAEKWWNSFANGARGINPADLRRLVVTVVKLHEDRG